MSDVIIAKVYSATIEEEYRIVKALVFGDKDVRTADEAMPHGIDSHAIKNLLAVWLTTTVNDQPVIGGYVNKNRRAEVGEIRTYSTDADGNLKSEVWQKANGDILIDNENSTINIKNTGEVRIENPNRYVLIKADGTVELGGTVDNAVRYKPMETAINEIKGKLNDLITVFNSHTHPTAAPGAPSTPTPGPGIPATSSTADITPAKITEIKTL